MPTPEAGGPAPEAEGVDDGKVAFDALLPRLLAIPPDRLIPVTLDLQKVAIVAAAVGRFVRDPERRARFAALPAAELDMGDVDGLEAVARCCIHVAVSQQDADATASEARIPGELAEKSEAVRLRMRALATYHFGDDEELGPIVRDIAPSAAYITRASDLVRLADIYAKRADIVKTDAKNYVATDAADARKYAGEILRHLGEARNVDQRTWTGLASRAFTLLHGTYDEVAQAGRWLFRHDDPDGRFPSLYAAARNPRSKSAPKPPGTGKPGVPSVPDLATRPAAPARNADGQASGRPPRPNQHR